MPPMWVNGQAIGYTSPSANPSPSTMPVDDAISEASVWRIPFGAAVVPEE